MNLENIKPLIPILVFNQIPNVVDKFQINTPLRLAHFLSQCSHESGNFTKTTENLNYKDSSRVVTIFRKFDKDKDRIADPEEIEFAKNFVGKPDKLANYVYADRMGNGNEISGDGYKFRGRGYIQLTGRTNYTLFDKFCDDDIISNPDLVSTKHPLLSAAWFFSINSLNKISDKGSSDVVVREMTKKINGGDIGLVDRIKHFNEYYNTLIKD